MLTVATRTAAARAVDLRKVYGAGAAAVEALRGVSVEFAAGEFTAIMGASGSGKSTLLHIMAGLDKPTSGTVWIGDQDLTHLKDRDLTEIRRDRVGFVFQAFNLVPTLTAAENITLPTDIAGRDVDRGSLRRGRRHDRDPRSPDASPVGALRRSAAASRCGARARLATRDRVRGRANREPGLARVPGELLAFLKAAVTDHGQTIVMVTHDPTGAAYADRIVFLADGQIVDEMRDPTAEKVLDRMKLLEV